MTRTLTSFNSTGRLTQNMGGVDIASSVLVQPSGGIVVAGTSYGGGYAALARFTSTGTLDTSFGNSNTGIVNVPATYGYRITRDSLDSLSDGNLLLAGVNGGNVALYRFTATGQADTSFGNNGTVLTDFGGVDYAYDLSVQSDQKIVIAGITAYDQSHINWITARYNPDGSLDPNFGSTGKVTTYFGASTFAERDIANALTILPDGQMLMAGVADAWGAADWAIARYNGGDQTAAIASLSATPASSSEIDLSWTLRAVDATSIQVQRSTDGVVFTTIATLAGTATGYADTDPALTENTHYWYEVRVTEPASSTLSNVATAITRAGVFNMTATGISTSWIDLAWTNVPANAVSLQIQRSTDGTNFTTISSGLSASTTSYGDTAATLTEATHYYYRVQAVGSDGSTNIVSADCYTTPTAPSSVTATAIAANQVAITWANASSGASSLYVQRSDDGGATFAIIASCDASSTSYTDTVTGGSSYEYRIVAAAADGASTDFGADTVTVTTPTAGVSGLAAIEASATEIDLSWTINVNDATAIEVDRSTDGITYTTLTSSLDPAATGYADTSLTPGQYYSYRVRVNEPGGYSGFVTTTGTSGGEAPTNPHISSDFCCAL